MKEQKYQKFSEICKKNGLKCTSQRFAVYDFIADNLTHPDVNSVWSQVKKNFPAITRESVYRILNEFVRVGIIYRLDHVTSACYDSQTGPHGHFICETCGEITDFAMPSEVTLPIDSVNGKVRHIELRITGICDKCNQVKTLNNKGENHD